MCEVEQFFNLVKPVKTNHDLIRVGGQVDGGYLIPDDLEGIETCFLLVYQILLILNPN